MSWYVLTFPVEIGSATTEYSRLKPPDNVGDAPRCSLCGEPIGLLYWLPPYRVVLNVLGEKYGDIAFASTLNLLVSQRFKEMYFTEDLSGFEAFEPVEIVRVKSQRKLKTVEVPKYFHVWPRISRAALDDSASGLVRSRPSNCSECRLGGTIERYDRIVLETGSWSGEDVFVARGLPGTILVSSRFEEVCRKNKIENAIFIPTEHYHRGIDDPIG